MVKEKDKNQEKVGLLIRIDPKLRENFRIKTIGIGITPYTYKIVLLKHSCNILREVIFNAKSISL